MRLFVCILFFTLYQVIWFTNTALSDQKVTPAKREYRCFQYNTQTEAFTTCGSLSAVSIGSVDYISLQQLCYSFKCKLLYQWPLHRAIVKNNTEQFGAIVSSLTNVALIDGKVFDYDYPVVSEPKKGFLVPIALATELVFNLKLGRIDTKELEPEKKSEPEEKKLETLVLDPGHGGNDFGTSYGSITEKDLSLIYALKLKDELNKQIPDLKVYLTREEDRFVSLSDRARFANEKRANLFLSLHVNHAPNKLSEGIETYILNSEATDDKARKLALLENETWLKTAQIAKNANHNPESIQKLLIDLEQTKYIQNSALIASSVQQEVSSLAGTYGVKNRGVKQALFYVLSQVAMPSALIEIGFLSSTGDRGRMMNIHFRDDFINRLVFGIKRYKNLK